MKKVWQKISLLVSLLLIITVASGLFILNRQGLVSFDYREPYVYEASRRYSKQTPNQIAFVNVTVLPMNQNVLLANQTVLVQDGVIQQIAPSNDLNLHENTLIIDGTGRYLMPGLSDMHVHIEDPNELLLFLAYGVTTVRNMWGNTGFKLMLNLPNQLELREQINRGDLLGPSIYTTGPILEGVPRTTPMMMSLRNAKEAREIVIEQAEAGFDAIKVYDNLNSETYQAILDTAKDYALPVIGHVPFDVGLANVLAGGQQSIEHLTGYLDPDSAKLLIPEAELNSYAQQTREADVWNVPSFSIWLKRIPDQNVLNQKELRYVSPRIRRIWKTFANTAVNTITYEGDDYSEHMQHLMNQVTKALHEAGAGLLSGTDSDNAYLIPGLSLHEELEYLVEAGLSPFEVLKTSTYNAALALGTLDKAGTVEEAKRADLILLEANPLDDIANTQQLAGVMLRGRWFEQKELQATLNSLAESYME